MPYPRPATPEESAAAQEYLNGLRAGKYGFLGAGVVSVAPPASATALAPPPEAEGEKMGGAAALALAAVAGDENAGADKKSVDTSGFVV